MIRFKSLLLASVLASLSATAPMSGDALAQAQPGAIIAQPAEGTKSPPPAAQQPGAVVGSAADSPPVAAQADGQPVITPGQDPGNRSGQQPSQAQAVPTAPPPGSSTMPENPTRRTPEPSAIK